MAELSKAVDRLVDGPVRKVLHALLVDMATRCDAEAEGGDKVVGYWMRETIRIDIKKGKA
jgi:hypothetical protein